MIKEISTIFFSANMKVKTCACMLGVYNMYNCSYMYKNSVSFEYSMWLTQHTL